VRSVRGNVIDGPPSAEPSLSRSRTLSTVTDRAGEITRSKLVENGDPIAQPKPSIAANGIVCGVIHAAAAAVGGVTTPVTEPVPLPAHAVRASTAHRRGSRFI